jgi:hypothetical protein
MKSYLLTTGCVHLLYISLNVCFLSGDFQRFSKARKQVEQVEELPTESVTKCSQPIKKYKEHLWGHLQRKAVHVTGSTSLLALTSLERAF